MAEEIKESVILVVDDDRGLLRLVERVLRREKYSVATAGSGADALIWLDANVADLVVLDLKLADIEAGELVGHLVSVGHPVPFIIITGQGDERVAVEMMRRGALDYLVKDAKFIDFLPAVVRRALGQLAKARQLAEAEEALRRSEMNLAHAQQLARLGGYEINIGGTGGDHWSEETFRILGLDPAKDALSLDHYISRCVHPDDQAGVRATFDAAQRERVRADFEYRIVRPDGPIRHLHSIVEPVTSPENQVVKFIGTLQDITDRKIMEREILEISEREQSRIGQDLHDGLCQHLAGIEFRLLGLKQTLAGKSKRAALETSKLAKLVRQAIEETRTLARGLSPVMLEPAGLMAALRGLAAGTTRTFNISCSFHSPAPVLIHNNAVAAHLYRIAQEAVHNAIRHGHAKSIVIQLSPVNGRIILGVRDDGKGFPGKALKHEGMGLRLMHYRAGLVGGSLAIQCHAEGGTSVVCSLRTEAAPEFEAAKKPPV